MRLRLVIYRHALPETSLVWDVSASEESSTIAALLESINRVVPLESEEGNWGLEDYAVEIPGYDGAKGFECLHFGVVGRVFRDDEVVWIRPLLTQDARMRRESGRTQISMDGMKLIDGVPFGKLQPLREKRIRRPPVSIPPLKRRRITYDQDDDDEIPAEEYEAAVEEGENGNRQLVLSTHFEDDDDDEEDDEDFVPGGEDDNDEAQPDEDDDLMDDSDDKSSDEEEENPLIDYYDKHGLPTGSIESGKALEHMAKVLGESSKASSKKGKASHQGKKIVFSGDETTIFKSKKKDVEPTKANGSASSENESSDESSSDESDESNSDDSSDEDEDSDEDSSDDSEGDLSKDDDSSESDSSDDSASSDSDSNSDSAPEEVSSKGTTPGNGSSTKTKTAAPQPQVQQKPTVAPYKGKTSTKARNERRRNTNALKRMQDRGIVPAGTNLQEFTKAGLSTATTIQEAEEALKSAKAQTDVVLEATPKSAVAAKAAAEFEARRKQLLESLSSGGIEVGTTKERSSKVIEKIVDTEGDLDMCDTGALNTVLPENGKEATDTTAKTSTPAVAETLTIAVATKDADKSSAASLNSRDLYEEPVGKENCLQGLTFVFTGVLQSMTRNQARDLVTKYGGKVIQNPTVKTNYIVLGSDVGPSKLAKIEKMKLQKMDKEGLFELITKSVSVENNANGSVEEVPETPVGEAANLSASTAQKQTADTASSTPESLVQARRAKLDIGAGRRLLFASLGIKNPKTKADEEKVRNDFMKLAKPLKAVEEPIIQKEQEVDEDPDAWREKINLRGVECCQEGIELSEPPFPFVQRWDPQQQGPWPSKTGRGGKRKRGKRDQSHYYDEEVPDMSNKHKRQKSLSYDKDYDQSYGYPEEQSYVEANEMELNYDDPIQNDNAADANAIEANKVVNVDSQGELDDLPPLPNDLSTLSKLNAGDAKAGMVIAFKHLIMGPNYQPQYSQYKTAVILKVFDSGELELTLAKRDREQREYDEDTGERIYGHFEMPDEDEDQEDDGFLALTYPELTEPLVVQEAPDSLVVAELTEDSPTNDVGGNDKSNDDSGKDDPVTTLENTKTVSNSNEAPTENSKNDSAEKQGSTDNSTTMEHERADNSPQKFAGTPLDQDSPIKSVEDVVEDEAIEKPVEMLTEDLLQQSAENSLADAKDDIEQTNPREKTPCRTAVDDDEMEVDETFLEHGSLGKDDQSTPRPTIQQQDRTRHDVEVPETASKQKSPNRDHHKTPSLTSRGGDGMTIVQVDDSFLDKSHDGNSTPLASIRSEAGNDAEKTPASISESARHEVSLMMRDAGFRTDVPSSILREHQLNVLNTPGDAAVFEKLMREMAPDTGRKSYIYSSPKFQGFPSSSPLKAHTEERDIEMSPTPVTWEKPTFASPELVQVSGKFPTQSSSIHYPKLQNLSSWTSQGQADLERQSDPDFVLNGEDIHLRPLEEFGALVNRQDEESSMIRAAVEEFPSAQPRDISELIPRDFEASMESVVHMPDTEDYVIDLAGTSPIAEQEPLAQQSPSPLPDNRRISSSSTNKGRKKIKKDPESDYVVSSDSSSLPSLKAALSQSQRIKSESRDSQSQAPASQSQDDLEYEAAMTKHDDSMYDSDEDFVKPLPKLRATRRTSSFQKKTPVIKDSSRRASASQALQGSQAPRSTQPSRLSQAPRSSQAPKPSQTPALSQMIDLTLSSSDAEPESQPFSTAPQTANDYGHDQENEDEDEDYTGPLGSGWAPKRMTRGKSIEVGGAKRRVTEGGRVSSTQVKKEIPRTVFKGGKNDDVVKGRRKTTSRF